MNVNLSGQTAVVIGAAQGIGRAIATAFAEERANLGLVDIDEGIRKTAEQISEENPADAIGIAANVSDFDKMCETAGEIKSTFGRIDHVVFAVGIGSGKFGFPFWNLEPGDWPKILNVNVVGAVNATHAFYQHLIDAEAGTLTFLSSVAGQIGSQTDPPYSASKAALINFSQCAAKDLAPHGVRVNTICPGMVQTALNRSVWESWARNQPEESWQSYEEWAGKKIRNVVPLNRWQEPEDIANMAVFLASNAARNITGQTINVDGGFVMHW